MSDFVLHLGDCLEHLRTLPEDSIDAVVTDPPYHLTSISKRFSNERAAPVKPESGVFARKAAGFMGKAWDGGDIAFRPETWWEIGRVMKPGAHLMAFGGTRTYHRMACAIEDAGLEIRDSLHWVYGSGFPKSLDVSKAIDKIRFDRADVLRVTAWIAAARDRAGLTNRQIDEAFGFNGMAGHWTSQASQPLVPTLEQVPELLELLGEEPPADVERLMVELNGRKGEPGEAWFRRPLEGVFESHKLEDWRVAHQGGPKSGPGEIRNTPATNEAATWQGWGTALKPSHEPIILARKPLAESSIARQVLATGTGGINVDGCRVGSPPPRVPQSAFAVDNPGAGVYGFGTGTGRTGKLSADVPGRWPPNLLLSHLPECEDPGPCAEGCAVRELDQQSDDASRVFSCFRYQAKPSKAEREEGTRRLEEKTRNRVNPGGLENDPRWAPVKRRNIHPTVKPVELMRWLVRLVTPPGGVVLDPFTGSGTTGVAALREGFRFHGCERDEDYHAIALARIEWEAEHPLAKAAAKAEEANPGQLTLFAPPAEREGEG